ncbi:MAG: FitA-like ribbon-helix-helix domain-containing protein [Thermoanaerobaculia bacterium]
MAVLNIRNLPPEVHTRLRVRAAKAGRSMEAEARAILTRVVLNGEGSQRAADLRAWVDALYAAGKPAGVVDDLLAERRRESERE